jgi:hypothetical protein
LQLNGWFREYNFGSREAVMERWGAAQAAGVDYIATDQYEALAAFLKRSDPHTAWSTISSADGSQ